MVQQVPVNYPRASVAPVGEWVNPVTNSAFGTPVRPLPVAAPVNQRPGVAINKPVRPVKPGFDLTNSYVERPVLDNSSYTLNNSFFYNPRDRQLQNQVVRNPEGGYSALLTSTAPSPLGTIPHNPLAASQLLAASQIGAPFPKPAGLSQTQLKNYHKLFSIYDRNASGRIGVVELSEALRAQGHVFSDAEAAQMIRSGDYNGDAQIDFNEFVAIMTSRGPIGGGVPPGRRF